MKPVGTVYRTHQQVAELQARILTAKNQGLTFQQIADQESISIGYAHILFTKGVRAIPEKAASEYRNDQLARIRAQRAVVQEILESQHLVVSNGHIVSRITGTQPVMNEDGSPNPLAGQPIYSAPLIDDAVTLAAIDRLVKLDDQETKLLGLNAPLKTQTEIDGRLRYEVVGISPEDLV